MKKGRPRGPPFRFYRLTGWPRLVVVPMNTMMLFALARFVLRMLLGARRMLANEVAGAAMLLIRVAASVTFDAPALAMKFFPALLMLLGIIAERDLGSGRDGDCGRRPILRQRPNAR